jgi:hypothetical protein
MAEFLHCNIEISSSQARQNCPWELAFAGQKVPNLLRDIITSKTFRGEGGAQSA